MNDGTRTAGQPPQTERTTIRLAEGALAAVDVCRRGMLHLHIGALTLRMGPCGLSELISTLGQAVAAREARRFSDEGAPMPLVLHRLERGEA